MPLTCSLGKTADLLTRQTEIKKVVKLLNMTTITEVKQRKNKYKSHSCPVITMNACFDCHISLTLMIIIRQHILCDTTGSSVL